jgi:hypothetical protein
MNEEVLTDNSLAFFNYYSTEISGSEEEDSDIDLFTSSEFSQPTSFSISLNIKNTKKIRRLTMQTPLISKEL